MNAEPVRYGLLRAEDVMPKGGRSNAAFPDSHNPSPIYAKARADAMAAAFEQQRLAHEVDCAAFYVAKGPFKFSGSISWTLRADDPSRAATLTLHPLPSRSVEDLLKAGIISPSGVEEEAFRKECERLRL
jgi:hypothetical protein